MSHSYPIWNDIDTNGGKESSANFGARDSFVQYVYVGTDPKNSHTLAKIEVHRNERHDGLVEFTLRVDGALIKYGTLDGKVFAIDIDGTNQAD